MNGWMHQCSMKSVNEAVHWSDEAIRSHWYFVRLNYTDRSDWLKDENWLESTPDDTATVEKLVENVMHWEKHQSVVMHRDKEEYNVFQMDEEQNTVLSPFQFDSMTRFQPDEEEIRRCYETYRNALRLIFSSSSEFSSREELWKEKVMMNRSNEQRIRFTLQISHVQFALSNKIQ